MLPVITREGICIATVRWQIFIGVCKKNSKALHI